MKRVLSWIVVLCMVLSLPPTAVFAADSGSCGENVTWSYADGVLTISGTGAMDDYKNADRPWEELRSEITTIVVEEGITSIGAYAFQYFLAAKQVLLPQSLTRIGEYAFSFCYVLEDLKLPDGVISIGAGAFEQCKALKRVEIPAGVTEIQERTFNCALALEEVVLPAGVTVIGPCAFERCSALCSVQLPSTLTTLSERAFSSCTVLSAIEIPASVTTIGRYCFSGSGLVSLEIPATVQTVDSFAFYNCGELTDLTLPEAPILYGQRVFGGAESLTEVTIPASMTRIPAGMFGTSGLVRVDIPEGVEYIGESAFEYCVDLAEVKLPQSLDSMFEGCFANCSSLTEIELPSGLNYIPYGGFQRSGLVRIVIPEGVKSIKEYAFCDCDSLVEVVLPETVEYMEAYCFRDCDKLTEITLPEALRYIPEGMFFDGAITHLEVPGSVDSIGYRAFDNCDSLTEITLPDSVLKLEDFCFEDCDSLTSIELPQNLEIIEFGAFRNSALTSIEIPQSVREIHGSAFRDCTALRKIILPDAVEVLGESCFEGCTLLTSLDLPESLTEIAWSLVRESGIVECVIPENVREIGYHAFRDCAALERVVIPGDVHIMGEYVFDNAPLVTVSCWENTAAHRYCLENGTNYVLMDEDPEEPVYNVGLLPSVNGTVVVSAETSRKDRYVSFDFAADEGYEAEKLVVWYDSSVEPDLALSMEDEDTAGFYMPGCDVLIEVRFASTDPEPTEPEPEPHVHDYAEGEVIRYPTSTQEGLRELVCTGCGEKTTATIPVHTNPFTDLKEGAFYYESVLWAANWGVANGMSEGVFAPDAACTRGQVVTFLWRAMGCPEPEHSVNPFTDVQPGSYCYEAVLWAVEQGITKGRSESVFDPGGICDRGQVVTFLYRCAGSPVVSDDALEFADVQSGRFYFDAVRWAVAEGITKGTAATAFSPEKPCTRGQVVTFLYRSIIL